MNRALHGQRKTFFSQDGQRKLNLAKLKDSNLFGWSVGVIVALFGALGMSFTPVEEDGSYPSPENDSIILNLGDTTRVIGGPRRSHWHWTTTSGSGCSATTTPHYQSSVDYAETKVQTRGNGSATISTTETANVTSATSASTNTTAGSTASISWNSGLSHSDQTTAKYTSEQIIAAHKKVFTLTAEPINADYYFLGWGTSTSESSIVSADNPYTVTSNMGITGYTDASSQPANYATNTYTETYYAFFRERLPANITLKLPTNGTVKYSYESYSNVTLSAETTITTKADLTLVAVPDKNCRFYGWYTLDGTTENFISTSETYTRAYPDDITIYAKFVPNSQATFTIKGTDQYFYDLGQACAAAASSSSKIVYPIADGTVPAGNYTIPDGVTLLIPYEGTTLNKLTAPALTYYEKPANVPALSCYRKLILLEGANITCNGTICVGGQIASLGGGYPSGYPFGACGVLDMSNGGHIDLNSGANLYAWGFVKGQDMDQGNNTIGVGTITAKSGSKVWEDFTGENRGGSACSALAEDGKSYKSFPFQGYAIQNIEVPVTYQYQSTLQVYTALYIRGNITKDFPLISSSGSLFLVQNSTSQVRKWYDPTTDLACYELSGTAKLDAINTTIYVSVNSADFNLPISSNMHIILDNCTMTLSNPVQILPDAVIEIKANSTATISSNMFMYDKDDWKKGIGAYYFASFKNLTSHKNRGDGTSNATLDDAKLIVDGTLNVTGKLYSTTGGANICGNGGGTITFSSLPTASNLYQCWGAVNGSETYEGVANVKSFSSITGGKTYLHAVAVNSANLHNEDGSYTQSAASSTFHNVNGRWFTAANKDENESTHVYDHFIYISDGQPVSGSSGSTTETKALYAPDKTGLVAGMKWCNVVQDGTCSNIFNATQALNETPASDIRYTYPSDSWLQLLRTETEGVYGGSDNSLYAVDGCAVNSLGSVDENCLYTINDVKKALVDGHFVALEKNTEDEAWHDVANPTNYYISFAGCTWHPATKYAGEEKAYIVEGGIYIWYNNDWLLVEREDPFFFDYNDQNVKRYYEYDNGAWVLASPRVRVVDAIETRDFYKLPDAITVASGKKNATITILKDISGINNEMTFTAANTTCTLDLNGHTVSGAVPFTDDNNRGMLKINASGTTFTITDNSANKEGRLENICNQNKVTYTVHLMAGTLNVEHGTIHAENPAQYASKVDANFGVSETLTACGSRAVQVGAGQKLNINGGRLEAFATRNAFGIVASGNNANTTQVTVTNGEVYAEAPCAAYAINCLGKLNVSGGLIEAKLNDHLVDASYAATDASNNINKHQTCHGIYMQGSANKAATSCYFGTLTMTGGTVKATSDVAANYISNVFGINLYADFAGTGAANTKATDGTLSQKYAAKATIENAKIEVNTKANYGYGIIGYGRYNSADKSTSVIKIKNTEVDVYARAYAYGILSSVRISSGTGNGGCTNADIDLTNCDVYAETTTAEGAYAVWSSATQGAVYEYTYKDGVATATNSIYAGEYAIGANMTVHSGRYEAKTKTSSAYASGTSTKQINTYSRHSGTALYQQLGGQVEAYSTLNIEDGTFIATAGTETARAVSNGGNTTITGGTFQATATTRYAYCIYAISGTLNVSNATITATSNSNTANGIHLEGTIAANTMFAYAPTATLTNLNVTATTGSSTTARALYVAGKALTQTEAQKEALTSSNRNNYYNIYQVGEKAIAPTVTVHGGTYTATAGTSSAYGAHSPGTSISTNKVATASPVMNLYNATFVAQTGTSTSAYGVSAGGPTLIDGCTITATAGNATKYQSTASGVRAVDKTTTIKNSTITATATDAAYGLEGYVEINATHGYCFHGEFDLSEAGNTEVTAEAKTSGKKAYTIYLKSAKKNIASGNFAGDYATAASATINGGTYNAKFTTSGSAYVISLDGKQTQGSVVTQPEVEVLDGFFNGATAEVGTAGVVGHMQLKGGYFVHPTNLATYAVAPKSVWTLPNTHEHYNPYKYKVTEHYTITFNNGTTPLQQNDLEAGTTPTYSGTPTKDADAQYTYTFDGWSTTNGGDKLAALPAVSANATYYAHFSKAENKYTVSVAARTNGAVSPASVSEIGFETASGDITATPDAGYTFSGWTLPDGVTAANGYSATSNPIHIHATAAGKTITANFVARNDISYTVKHYQQNIADDDYTEVTADRQNLTGTTAAEVTPAVKEYTGFTAPSTQTKAIAADGLMVIEYRYTRNSYTLSWVTDGDALTGSYTNGSTKYEAPITVPTTPTKTGYTFNGWNPAVPSVMPANNVECVAQWTANTNTPYIVKHYKQQLDGTYSATPDETDNLTGTTATEVTPSVKSYTGFTAPSTQTKAIAADGLMVIEYRYTRNSYTLSWVTDGDALTGSYTNGSTKYEAPITVPTTPTKTGYTFNGWNPAVPSTMPAANTTYTATWTINQYTLTVESNNAEWGTVTGGGDYSYNTSVTIKASPKQGFKFVEWNDGNTNASREVTVTASVTYTATFDYDIANYTVKHWQQNVTDDNYTEVMADRETKQGTTAKLTAATAKSYTGFTALSFEQGIIAGNGTTVVNIYYNRNKYTVTWVDGNGETIETDENVKFGATPVYNGGTPPKTGTAQYSYTFNGWYPEVESVTKDATYTATFTETVNTYTITWRNKPADGEHEGEVLEIDENVPYNATPTYNGETPTIDPTTSQVFTFRAWTPEISSVTGDATYTADYTASVRPYPVKWVNYNGTVLKETTHNYGWDDIPAAREYDGETPTKPAETGKNYTFIGWSEPVSVVEGGDVTYTALFGLAITADEEHPVTISGPETASVTTVKVSGKLNVSAGTLTTTDLILEASTDGSGDITGVNNISVPNTGHVYFDYTFDTDPWHWSSFGVPFEIDLAANAPLKETTQALTLGSDYDIVYYDSHERATNGANKNCWRYVEKGNKKLTPGVLYLIAFNKNVGHVNVLRFTKATGADIDYKGEVSMVKEGTGTNANWNGIANPKTYHAILAAGTQECQVHDGGEFGKDGYHTYTMKGDEKDYKFFVGKAAFVQVPDEQSSITVSAATDQDAIVKKAPRRAQATVGSDRYDIMIAPLDGEMADRLFVLAEEDKADEYVIVADLAKAGVSPVRAQMWVNRYGEKLCKNTAPLVNSSADYPLGISVPQTGEYEIYVNAQPAEESVLYLTFDGKPVWNLNYGGYITTLDKGTTERYGLRLVKKASKVPTGMEELTVENGGTIRKVLVDDKIYIIRNGKTFTVTGQTLKY